MLFLKSLIPAFLAFIMAVLPLGGAVAPEDKTEPRFNGTFLQSWLSSSWDEDRWAEEVAAMEEDGVKYLVLQDLASKDAEGNWDVYYESKLEAFSGADFGGDVLSAALAAVKGTDIQLFVGLAAFDNLWSTGTLTKEYSEVCDVTADMMEEIYNKYFAEGSNNFYAWYFTMEYSNNVIMNLAMPNIIKGLNVVLDKATEIDSDIPLMMSPFTSNYLTLGKGAAFVQWLQLFTQAHWRDGDIVAPQDAVGAGWMKMEDLETVWKMYSIAAKYASANVKLWANCENFTSAIAPSFGEGILNPPATENTVYVPVTLDRFTKQMNIAAKYCENIITFSYNHYYCPEQVSSVYIDTYKDYLDNGYGLETEAPLMKGDFTKTETSEGIALAWEEAEDNIGISHYRILRNGEFLCRAETFDGYHRTSAVDAEGKIGDTYTIIAYDGAGNASAALEAR
ncbi:MAG: DUF4434 domain-containing protein [Clostridia bacterium]|nr:DUF4434 domain-containing protein [Clostridia bacterium]